MPTFFMDASAELHPQNPAYSRALEHFVWGNYLMDLGDGDVTTRLFIAHPDRAVTAALRAGSSGILAGMQEALWFLKKVGLRVDHSFPDGARVKKGAVVLRFSGSVSKIFAAERTLLNLIQRMSGVATATHRLVSKLPDGIRLLATRKTLWGLLDKRAVSIGGGATHRLNLSDAVLIKDNHWELVSNSVRVRVSSARSNFFVAQDLRLRLETMRGIRFVEVEVQNEKQLNGVIHWLAGMDDEGRDSSASSDYAKASSDSGRNEKIGEGKFCVMLDNFKPAEVRRAVQRLKPFGVLIEVSGGIDEENIRRLAIPGVGAISCGAITHSAAALDFSLSFKP